MDSEKVSFKNDRGLELVGLVDGEGDKGVVLCSHFTGFKEFKHLYKLAKALSAEGMQVLRFDYSDCIGGSQGTCEDMSVSHQLRDTSSAIDFLENRGVKSIGLFGHSLGATTVIATAANDKRVRAIVSAAGLARLEWDTLFKSKAEEWEKQGFITFPSWKKGEIKIKYGFYLDLKKYDASQLVQNIDAPVLVVQPGEDELVSMKNAQAIYDNAGGERELKIVEGANHMFSKPEHEQELVALAVDWFKKYL